MSAPTIPADAFVAFETFVGAAPETAAQPASAPVRRCPAPGLSRYMNWILMASAVLVLATAALYYWRRKQTTTAKDKASQLEGVEKRLTEELEAVAQRQAMIEDQVKQVAKHSRSVENGLSQALQSWSETTETLASQLGSVQELKRELMELLAEDGPEAEAEGGIVEEEEQDQDGEGVLEAIGSA